MELTGQINATIAFHPHVGPNESVGGEENSKTPKSKGASDLRLQILQNLHIVVRPSPIELTDNFVDVSTFSRCDTVRILPPLSLGRSSLHSPGRSWPRPHKQALKLSWNRDHQER